MGHDRGGPWVLLLMVWWLLCGMTNPKRQID